jgi:quercetin dioxygenase-like cupin family protein
MALHHPAPGEIVNLGPLGSRLRNATSSALVKTEQFEAIRLVVPAGGHVPPHRVTGHVTLHCLEGRVDVDMPDGKRSMSAGDWLYLEKGDEHAVHGLDDASLLMTVYFV